MPWAAASAERLRSAESANGVPRDLPVIERSVVRVVVLDKADRLLLFHTRDPQHRDFGTWWELPGGGIEPGETYLDAAVRELREETGIVVGTDQVGAPTWRRLATFIYRDGRRLQHEVIVPVRLDGAGPPVDESGRQDYEKEDYFDFRWWPVPEIVGSTQRFYPGRLPELLPAFLSGEEIDEPLEVWS